MTGKQVLREWEELHSYQWRLHAAAAANAGMAVGRTALQTSPWLLKASLSPEPLSPMPSARGPFLSPPLAPIKSLSCFTQFKLLRPKVPP